MTNNNRAKALRRIAQELQRLANIEDKEQRDREREQRKRRRQPDDTVMKKG